MVGLAHWAQSFLLHNHVIIQLVTNGHLLLLTETLIRAGTSRLGDSCVRNPDFTQERFPWVGSLFPAVWVEHKRERKLSVCQGVGSHTQVSPTGCASVADCMRPL